MCFGLLVSSKRWSCETNLENFFDSIEIYCDITANDNSINVIVPINYAIIWYLFKLWIELQLSSPLLSDFYCLVYTFYFLCYHLYLVGNTFCLFEPYMYLLNVYVYTFLFNWWIHTSNKQKEIPHRAGSKWTLTERNWTRLPREDIAEWIAARDGALAWLDWTRLGWIKLNCTGLASTRADCA